MRRFLAFGLCLAGGLFVVGCGGDSPADPLDGSMRDAAADAGFGGTSGAGGAGGMGSCADDPIAGGDLGGQCRGMEQLCNGNLQCFTELQATIGGPNDPIMDLPGGEEVPIESSLFPDNYCTIPLLTTPGTCDTAEDNECAAECGVCVPFFVDADICLRACNATVDDNSVCRDGYACSLISSGCDTGCETDNDCRISRPDTNMNGMADPFDPDDNPMGDRLVYDTTSQFTCNQQTFRCEHPGTPGAEAGIACDDDEQCEANGDCLGEGLGFAGGMCTKFRCDIPGNDCAGDGVCQIRGFGIPVCGQACKVGDGAIEGMPDTYLNNTQGCREDYTCVWDGVNDDTAPTNGACVPGEYNDVTMPNIGTDCDDDSECYSPLGQGVCDADFDCTVLDCPAPGTPNDVCGTGNLCVIVTNQLAVCLRGCDDATDCEPGRACAVLDPDDPMSDAVCFPFCIDDGECRSGETCNQTTGLCEEP